MRAAACLQFSATGHEHMLRSGRNEPPAAGAARWTEVVYQLRPPMPPLPLTFAVSRWVAASCATSRIRVAFA